MVKQAFKVHKEHTKHGVKSEILESVKISAAEYERIEYMNDIIEEYQGNGYTLSVRQLYYQLVARAYIENTAVNYGAISKFVTKARLAGLVDWEAIEDRGRVPHIAYYSNSISESLADALNSFEVDRQLSQDNYVEVWCEKDALTGILQPVTQYYHVPLLVNKGYSSATAVYNGSKRFKNAISDGKTCTLLYLGDHDPSGLDMVTNDIPNRLLEFEVPIDKISIRHIALTTEQVDRYEPPDNPAKKTDTRFQEYSKNYGVSSWEVDALKPEILDSLLRQEIESAIDMSTFKESIAMEQQLKKELMILLDNQLVKEFSNEEAF